MENNKEKINFNSLTPLQKKKVLLQLKKRKEEEEEKKHLQENNTTDIEQEYKKQIETEEETTITENKETEDKITKIDLNSNIEDELPEEVLIYKEKKENQKPLIHGLVGLEKATPKKEIKDDSWENLIAFEQEFKKRAKEQAEITRLKAIADKKKLNRTLFILIVGSILITYGISFFNLDNAELFRNSKFFFSR